MFHLLTDGMIVLGMILMTESGFQSDMRKGRIMAIVGLVLVSVFFSLILSVFRTKAQGYPYRFVNFRYFYSIFVMCFFFLSDFSFLFK